MEQNQKQEVFVTKITFTGVKEVEGGKVLLLEREYNTGARDLNSQTPVISDKDFDKYIELSIKQFEDTITNIHNELKAIQENYLGRIDHLNDQVELFKTFTKS